MDNSKTPRIVVGVGLAVVYASIAFYFLRDKPVVDVAQVTPSEPAAQVADVSMPPPAVIPDVPAPVVRAAPARAQSAAPRPEVQRPEASRQERVDPPALEPTVANMAAAPEQSEAATQVQVEGESPELAADVAPPVAPAVAPAGDDSQITAEVKAEIAAIAPAGTIDVTTTNGVVELTGSVHSQEDIERVRMAARNVPAVRDVDVSALMVSN